MSHGVSTHNVVKPITLTIIRDQTNVKEIPSFNHNPVVPTISPQFKIDERESQRLIKKREVDAKYRSRVKDYTKLGTMDTDQEKMYALLLLCRPELSNTNKLLLETKISDFLYSLNNS